MTARTENVGLGTKSRKGCRGWTYRRDHGAGFQASPWSGCAARAARLPVRHLAWSLPPRGSHYRAGRVLVRGDDLRCHGRGARGGSESGTGPRRRGRSSGNRRRPVAGYDERGRPSPSWRSPRTAERRRHQSHGRLMVVAAARAARTRSRPFHTWSRREPRFGLARRRACLRARDRRQPRRFREASDRLDRCCGRCDDLADGKPQRVEADGTPVLLLRQGNRIRAIGATCPHLGGPLDEGPIEGDTVTCPWHGSVFCLDDGALIHGPAMMPVAAYEVQWKDGRIAIRANAERAGALLGAGAG